VDEFDDGSEVESLLASIVEGARHEKEQGRAQPLAAGTDDVAADLADKGNSGVETTGDDRIHLGHVAGDEGKDVGRAGGRGAQGGSIIGRLDGSSVSNRKLCYDRGLSGNPPVQRFRAHIEPPFFEVNMYAVIKTGGKQYRVASGEKIKVEQIAADIGQEIVIDQVLAVVDGDSHKVGTPLVSGATVKATVVAHGLHDKVRIFKMRRRKHYQKRQGHRQQFTELQIGAIAV
jgi:large subunit ribosomal protein L21